MEAAKFQFFGNEGGQNVAISEVDAGSLTEHVSDVVQAESQSLRGARAARDDEGV